MNESLKKEAHELVWVHADEVDELLDRATLAERKRCVGIAESVARSERSDDANDEEAHGKEYAALKIATAIEKGEEVPDFSQELAGEDLGATEHMPKGEEI